MTQPNDAVAAGLERVLAAQHAAIYGYPLIGVTVTDDAQIQRARTLEAAHRLTRDAVSAQLVARHATPVAAEVEYRPAKPVTDAASAQQWAIELEEACAGAYRYFLATTAQTTYSLITFRQQAITGLSSAATEATRWRLLLTPASPTVPFPGL